MKLLKRLNVGQQLFLIIISISSIYPVWFILQTAMKTNEEYMLRPLKLPRHLGFENIRQVFEAFPVLHWAFNSVIVCVFSVALSTIIALFASYSIIFGGWKSTKFMINSNIALMVVPPVTLLIPMFALMVNLHLMNTLPSVIFFYTGLFLPFSIFLLSNFMKSVPKDLMDAAKIDGLSAFSTLARIVAPLSSAAIFTLMLVNAIYAWNELLIAMVFLQQQNVRTLMSGLVLFQGRFSTNIPLVMAGALISIIPPIFLYIFGQRFFVKGMLSGIGK